MGVLENTVAAQQTMIDSLLVQNASQQNNIDSLLSSVSALETQNSEQQSAIIALRTENTNLQSNVSGLASAVRTLETTVNALQQSFTNFQNLIFAYLGALDLNTREKMVCAAITAENPAATGIGLNCSLNQKQKCECTTI